ncbi:MAG: translesion error-prone DNA polymerase V autoproteolytic subunit [Cyanobacteria bacterium P01_F01_bin.33]
MLSGRIFVDAIAIAPAASHLCKTVVMPLKWYSGVIATELAMLRNSSATRVTAIARPDRSTRYARPLLTCPVSAGFPSPAEEWVEGKLDLNKHLIKNPVATYFVRVTGESMLNAGIHPGDLLVVDRALEPRPGKVVIAIVDGELTVKRLKLERNRWWLVPDNPDYPVLEIGEATDFQVWGVVTSVIHEL